jgi:signal transduction histidine kinase/ActR/RegA family two-component response regulator
MFGQRQAGEVRLRVLLDLDYGTEGYSGKFARRLRAVNLTARILVVTAFCFAVAHFLNPAPGMWKPAVVSALATLTFILVPLLHRFGPLAAAAALLLAGFAVAFVTTWVNGTGNGMHKYYLVGTALTFLYFGSERIVLSAVFGALAVVLIVVLEWMVPYNTGVQPSSTQFANFIVNAIVACGALLAIVNYALREAARAEENLAREYAASQEKTRQLEIADKYKSHFLASASHDLRQPLHALNLFVAQLRSETKPTERDRLAARIDAAVGSMNELFEALLDMTKLEAGVLQPNVTECSVQRALERIETTFSDAAQKKGLRLRVVSSSAWVRSDPILLERVLLNLVSNAVAYTERGGVVVGCRRRGNALRFDVCDTGPGIPEQQRRNIFDEYYRLGPGLGQQSSLGLGLAIVDRLSRLLGHVVELDSRPDRGSRFSVSVSMVAQPDSTIDAHAPAQVIADPARGKLIMVIDDDTLVLDGMRGILQSWGCKVRTAASGTAALAELSERNVRPDLIISDARLADGKTGMEAIARLRQIAGASVPALVITGDTAPERLREASAGGFHLLHKPVSPMALRTVLNRLLKTQDAARTSVQKLS